MRTEARQIAAVVVVGILAVSLAHALPAIAQRQGNVLGLALHFYPSTTCPTTAWSV